VHLPVTPLVPVHVVIVVDDEAFEIGFFLFTCQEIELIDTVDNAIVRNLLAGDSAECRQQVDDMDNLVTDTARGYLARPAHQEGRTHGALPRSEVIAAPGSGGAMPRVEVLGTVITEPQDHRVVPNLQVVYGIENLAGTVVDFREHVGVLAVAGSAIETWMRKRRQVRLRVGDKGEERPVVPGVALYEPDGTLIQFGVDFTAGLNIVGFNISGIFPPAHLLDHRLRSHLGIKLQQCI
jgi:hypothetical protein